MDAEKKHTYEYDVDLTTDTAPARVIRMVGQEKKVLEIGAGPGSITKHLKFENKCQVTALELDSEAIRILSPFCESVFQTDLNDPSWFKILKDEGRFEVVIVADVLEHLYDPLTVLKQISTFIDEAGCIIISLPHVGHSAIHACLLDEDFEYRDWGLLDRTHIRFFGIKNIQSLLENAGLKIIHAEFVVRTPEQTEFAERWVRTSKEVRSVLSSNPYGLVYQVIVKAVPNKAFGEAISLMDLQVIPQDTSFKDSVKAFLRTYLSAKMYTRVQLLASKMGITFKG